MRRSICYCEPTQCMAGEVSTWKFIYTPSIDLPKGTKLKFDLLSTGRDIDWEAPQANLKKTSNVIYVLLENKKVIAGKEIELKNSVNPAYEFVLPSEVEAGSEITIVVGSPKLTTKEESKTVQGLKKIRNADAHSTSLSISQGKENTQNLKYSQWISEEISSK